MLQKCIATGALLAALMPAPGASAEGALAIGTTGDIRRDGFAIGYAYDWATSQIAKDEALKRCREFKGAPDAAPQCQLVAAFKRECFAIVFDPKEGTPGFGWAVAPGKVAAEERAMAACNAAAGRERPEFCKLDISGCDTKDGN